MNKKLAVSLAAGTVVSVVTLYFAFQNVPLSELVRYLGSVDYLVIFPAASASMVAFVFRAMRWRVILGPARQVTFTGAFHPLMIGFMANCVYPGRIGEIARPLLLRAKSGVPFTTGLATVGVERLFDLLFLLALFGLAVSDMDPGAGGRVEFAGYAIDRSTIVNAGCGMIALGVLIAVAIVLITIEKTRNALKKTVAASTRLLFFLDDSRRETFAGKFVHWTSQLMENIATGFALVKSPRRIAVCLAYSTLVWAFTVASYYAMMKGSPGVDLSVVEIAAVMVMICFAIALPSVPGYWGLWEAGGVFALSLFGVESKNAAGYTLVNHAVQVFPVIVVGLASAWATGVSLKSISKHTGKKDHCIVDGDALQDAGKQI